MQTKLYSRNFTRYGMDLNPFVTLMSGMFILLFAGYAVINPHGANVLFASIKDSVTQKGDWVFILSSNFFIGLCLYLMFSRYGRLRLGGPGAKPEFSNFAWYSMLLSAGMGIGLMFWAVGEPLYHFAQTPPIYQDAARVNTAMATTFFHWGLHPWGIYTLMALTLAFFTYNKNLPLSLRSVFYPLLKDKIFGWPGDVIDAFAVVSCIFGLATSLGLGAQQINSGLDYLLGTGVSISIQVLLIAGITFIATISVSTGIGRGVRILSELNLRVAFVFMFLILLLGPTWFILKTFSTGLGLYLTDFVKAAFYIAPPGSSWQGTWSVFYLAWWISWSPFVGIFIARVSKGRTFREFIAVVMVVPSLLSFMWLSVFGSTAISLDQASGGRLFQMVQDNLPVALFEMLGQLNIPLAQPAVQFILTLLATVLIVSFFVTSSDSGSLVVDSLTSGGRLNSPKPQRVFWACMEGLVAAVLLMVGGEAALETLKTAVISTGLPLALLMVLMGILLLKSLRQYYKEEIYGSEHEKTSSKARETEQH